MSLPYHIGNGWFGGLLPSAAFAIAASTGDMTSGLWYPMPSRWPAARSASCSGEARHVDLEAVGR